MSCAFIVGSAQSCSVKVTDKDSMVSRTLADASGWAVSIAVELGLTYRYGMYEGDENPGPLIWFEMVQEDVRGGPNLIEHKNCCQSQKARVSFALV